MATRSRVGLYVLVVLILTLTLLLCVHAEGEASSGKATRVADAGDDSIPESESSITPLGRMLFTPLSWLVKLIRVCVATVLSVVGAIFSPFVIILHFFYQVLVVMPWTIFKRLTLALYPVYVFCAIAGIVGVCVGSTAGWVSEVLVSVLSTSAGDWEMGRHRNRRAGYSDKQQRLRARKKAKEMRVRAALEQAASIQVQQRLAAGLRFDESDTNENTFPHISNVGSEGWRKYAEPTESSVGFSEEE